MDDVKALFGLIDKKNKRRLLGAVICCVLSVLCGILPYLGVWGIGKRAILRNSFLRVSPNVW